MMLGWSSADVSLKEFSSIVVDPMAFLEEYVFFHHYIALEAAFHVFPNLEDRRDYCDKMVQAIDGTRGLPNTEDFGLPPVEFYRESDIKEALRGCFASFAGIRRVSRKICYRKAPQRTMSMEVAAPFEALYTATKARFMVSLMPSSSR